MDRRSMLKWAIRGIGVATAAMVGIPVLVAGIAPVWLHRPRQGAWQSLGPVDDFPVGEMQEKIISISQEPRSGRALSQKAVYAWRPSPAETVVYSRSCTDLGCPLTFDPGSQCFFCPCHGGIFDKEGNRMAGPPSRPMYRFASRIADGQILIDVNSVPPMA